MPYLFFFFNDTATTEIYTLSLHDALPIYQQELDEGGVRRGEGGRGGCGDLDRADLREDARSEEHTSELQSHLNLVCRLLLEKKKNYIRPRQYLLSLRCAAVEIVTPAALTS